MRSSLAGAMALLAVACVPHKGEIVKEPPRWLTEKDQVRVEIIRTLVEGGDDARALELIRMMRAEGVEREELDLYQGIAMRQQGMLEDAERMLVLAEHNMPKSAEVQTALCVLYADDNKLENAVQHCRRATKLDDHDDAAWNNLGFLLLSTGGDPLEAKAALQTAVDIDGNNIRYRNNLAFAQVATGDHRGALRTFLTTGTPADAHYNVGAAFEREGDAKTARTYYQRALRYDADHSLSDQALQRLDEDRGEEN